MTVLVTGASGFLGGALTRMLVDRGEQVRCLIRPTSDIRHLQDLSTEFVAADLSDQAALADAVAGVSIIYHCAALSTDWGRLEGFHAANVSGVANLLAAARRERNLDRFVHVGTTDVYGYPKRSDSPELERRDVGLPYNHTKIKGELLVEEAQLSGLPTTIVRPATIFGPRSAEFAVEMAGLLLEGGLPLIGRGRTQAGLIYVDDVAHAMVAAAHSPNTIGGAYNLRDPQPMTWVDYISELAVGIGADLPKLNVPSRPALQLARAMELAYRMARIDNRPLLTRHAVLILTRPQDYPIRDAQRDFGFGPVVGLVDGIRRTIDWLRSPEGRVALAKRSDASS